MPTRRTSPRRTATRPSAPYERTADVLDDFDDEPRSWFSAAAPWLALLAVVLSGAALAFAFVSRGSAAESGPSCRQDAWTAIPAVKDLPPDFSIGSTDLNANGMTISIVGPADAEGGTQPVVYASITCYGADAANALVQNRKAAEAAGANVSDRAADGSAYDVDNPQAGTMTTLFRVGGLIGQVADAGTTSPSDLAAITTAVAAAMGDRGAAGSAAIGADDGNGSFDPQSSGAPGSDEPLPSAFAPDLEAVLPHQIADTSGTASGAPPLALTVQSMSGSDVFADDPSSRALSARIRALGSTLDQLQVAQAFDETGSIDLSIVAFRLPKADLAKLEAAIIETWLSAKADGVTTSTVELAGKNLTKVDYGDASTIEYVYAKDDYVIVIDTIDLKVATAVAAELK